MENVKQRLVNLEGKLEAVNDYVNIFEYGNFVISRSLVLEGVRIRPDQDLEEMVDSFIHEGLDLPSVRVYAVKTMERRNLSSSTPPLVKVELKDEKTKIQALRARPQLAGKTKFKNIRMRSSQSHEERIMALNSKLLLSLIPGGENYVVTGNSRIVSKDDLSQRNNRSHTRDSQMGGGGTRGSRGNFSRRGGGS